MQGRYLDTSASSIHFFPASMNPRKGIALFCLATFLVQLSKDWFIFNRETKEFLPEIPFGMRLDRLPAVLSVSDQGAVNRSCLHFLSYSRHQAMLGLQWDPFHRCWNDIKTSLKQSAGFPWRMVLSLCIYFNLSYGPFQSGEWHDKKTNG